MGESKSPSSGGSWGGCGESGVFTGGGAPAARFRFDLPLALGLALGLPVSLDSDLELGLGSDLELGARPMLHAFVMGCRCVKREVFGVQGVGGTATSVKHGEEKVC